MGTGMSTRKSNKHGKNDWDRFSSFKQRGEWVELQFMAEAAQRRFAVSKPWGTRKPTTSASSTARTFSGCRSSPQPTGSARDIAASSSPTTEKRDYSLKEIDLFAAYVIPGRRLVPDPRSLAARQAQTHHGHAVPRSAAGKEGQLPLRMLPRSLEPAHQRAEPNWRSAKYPLLRHLIIVSPTRGESRKPLTCDPNSCAWI